jgi:hypothetical protein
MLQEPDDAGAAILGLLGERMPIRRENGFERSEYGAVSDDWHGEIELRRRKLDITPTLFRDGNSLGCNYSLRLLD